MEKQRRSVNIAVIGTSWQWVVVKFTLTRTMGTLGVHWENQNMPEGPSYRKVSEYGGKIYGGSRMVDILDQNPHQERPKTLITLASIDTDQPTEFLQQFSFFSSDSSKCSPLCF